jgi:hypothetical protein
LCLLKNEYCTFSCVEFSELNHSASSFSPSAVYIYIVIHVCVTVDGVWIGDSIYWLFKHSWLVTTPYRSLTQTRVLSLLQSPISVSWQRILTQEL